MSYKVGVIRDGHDEVTIKIDNQNFRIEQDYDGDGLVVELEYSKAKLIALDPEGYHTLLKVWPSVDELALYRHSEADEAGSEDWEQVFSGIVSKLDTDDHEITIAAHQAAIIAPNPITVDVIEDTADLTRLSVLVSSDNDGLGPVSVEWGDGTPDGHNIGDGAARSAHQYAAAGTYTVTATSDTDPDRNAIQVVTLPYPYAPLTLTVQEDTDDPARLTVLVTADNDGAGEVNLSFGDGATATNPGDGQSGNQHPYQLPGTYTLTATSVGDATRVASRSLVLPYTD